MRILYGVCGEGFGHSSIASEIIPYLESKGHKVKVVTYGRGLEFLKGFDIYPVKGLRISYQGEGVNHLKTVYRNVLDFPKNFLKMGEIKKEIEKFNPDICISDNEPIVAQAAYWKNLPLVSFSALNTFVFHDVNKPLKKQSSSLIAKSIIRTIVPKADERIALSFSDKTFVDKGVIYTSPIIRSAIRRAKPKKEDFVLAYLAKSHDYLVKIFERIPEKFVIYGIQNGVGKKNLVFRQTPETFAGEFRNCKAVISNSGFSVISEAIYLRKPIFMVPIRNQYEQFYNCLVVRGKGIGEFSESPKEKEIRNFLGSLNECENNMKKITYDADEPLRVLESVLEKFENAPDRI